MIITHLKIQGKVIVNEQFFDHPGNQMCAWFDPCYLEIHDAFLQCFAQGLITNKWTTEWIDADASHIDLDILYYSDNQESALKFQSSDLFKLHTEVLQKNGLTVQVFTKKNSDFTLSTLLDLDARVNKFTLTGPHTSEIVYDAVYWEETNTIGDKPKKLLWGTSYPMFDDDNNLIDLFWHLRPD